VALLESGRLSCWGNNTDLQCGAGGVLDSIDDAVLVAAGPNNTVVYRASGALWCANSSMVSCSCSIPMPAAIRNLKEFSSVHAFAFQLIQLQLAHQHAAASVSKACRLQHYIAEVLANCSHASHRIAAHSRNTMV
jgi:hypothetical protein